MGTRRRARENEGAGGFLVATLLGCVLVVGFIAWNRREAEPDAEEASAGLLPRVVLDRTSHSFGEVREEEGPRETTVEIRNEGAGTLEIKEVKASCGCTAALLEDDGKRLGPGEVTKVVVRFDPKGRREQNKSVSILTSDPERPSVQFTFDAEVVPIVAIEPLLLDFGEVRAGEVSAPREIILRQNTERPLTIRAILANPDEGQLTIERGPADERQAVLIARLHGGPRLGRIHGWVKVELAGEGPVGFSVTGMVVDSPINAPTAINLGRVQRAEGGRHEVVLQHKGPIKVTVAAVTPEGLTAEVEAVEGGTRLTVVIAPMAGQSQVRGTLSLATDHPRLPRLDLTLRGTLVGVPP